MNEMLVMNFAGNGEATSAHQGDYFLSVSSNDSLGENDAVTRLSSNGQVKLRRSSKFSFWYHMGGMAELQLFKSRFGSNGIEVTLLWQESDTNSSTWQRLEVDLCDENQFLVSQNLVTEPTVFFKKYN